MESSMSKAGLDNRHRNKNGEISHKHGNTLRWQTLISVVKISQSGHERTHAPRQRRRTVYVARYRSVQPDQTA
jgi:hypothetical protein